MLFEILHNPGPWPYVPRSPGLLRELREGFGGHILPEHCLGHARRLACHYKAVLRARRRVRAQAW